MQNISNISVEEAGKRFKSVITSKPIGYKEWWEEQKAGNMKGSLKKLWEKNTTCFPHIKRLILWCLKNPERAKEIINMDGGDR